MVPLLLSHLLRVDDGLHDLVAEGKGQVAILQQQPVSLRDGERHVLSGGLFLPLSHGQLVQLLHAGLGDGLNLGAGVGAGGKQADERDAVVGLLQHGLKVEHSGLEVLGSKRVEDVLAGLKDKRSVNYI